MFYICINIYKHVGYVIWRRQGSWLIDCGIKQQYGLKPASIHIYHLK